MKTILLTNDDGYEAPGLWALYEELLPLGRVIIVAPDRERSAASHAITLTKPLRVKRPDARNAPDETYSLNGSPADCVKVGISKILSSLPDLVVSGINRGANTGNNILYSGTVAGAAEGALAGIPALAVSRASFSLKYFEPAATIGSRIARRILEYGLPEGVFLNVNVPPGELKELKSIMVTRQGKRRYKDFYVERKDPRNQPYIWLRAEKIPLSEDDTSDDAALERGYISVTPLQINRTDERIIPLLEGWNLNGGDP
ncbi:5'/3'-nucleotidase SurE [candidate division CSSED10-310 bacterium]|uniref:5'-nucleotidase SurE n=1 Tax=candidate division CSSED10-310 bacterium TaxID=2855610 RepID=A0ABV6Z0I2_UNCC1